MGVWLLGCGVWSLGSQEDLLELALGDVHPEARDIVVHEGLYALEAAKSIPLATFALVGDDGSAWIGLGRDREDAVVGGQDAHRLVFAIAIAVGKDLEDHGFGQGRHMNGVPRAPPAFEFLDTGKVGNNDPIGVSGRCVDREGDRCRIHGESAVGALAGAADENEDESSDRNNSEQHSVGSCR